VLRNGADHAAILDWEWEQLLATIADLRARLDEERADRRLARMQLGEALAQVRGADRSTAGGAALAATTIRDGGARQFFGRDYQAGF
jgi:hypothetical protein